MRLDLNHGRLDSRRFINGHEPIQGDVGQSNGPASFPVDQTLHRAPGLKQRDAIIVDDLAGVIARVLFVSWLKRKRSVAEIEIDIAEAEPGKTRLEGWLDALRSMIRVPQFRGYK